MIDSETISQIMSELGLDVSDVQARKVLERLLASKPEVTIDQHFLTQLRNELQAQSAQVQPQSNKLTSMTNMFVNKVLASALVVMVVLAAGGFWYIQNRTDRPLFQSPQAREANVLLSGKYAINDVSQESFGDLNQVSIVASKDAAGLNNSNQAATTAPAMPEGGGYAGVSMQGSGGGPDTKLIAPGEPYPQPAQYTFEYTGGPINALSDTQAVYKRSQPKQPASIVQKIISMLSFGLIDFSKFNDVKLQNFSFAEDRDYGYGVYVDMMNGSVNISQNWEKWPQPENLCVKDYCGPKPRIEIGDVPPNDEVFKATDAFLSDYGISKEAYGDPQVIDQYWRIMYDHLSAADKASFYIPEQVQVVYPLILENQKVYDEGGQLNGLSVIYDIRQRKVVNVYELTTKQFEKSEYKGVTDAKHILDIATKGGFRNYTYIDQSPNVKTVKLQLATPSKQIVKLWYSDPKNNNMGGELYVPALVFPIQDWEKQGYWRPNVIVPLVQDILDSDQQPQPMPVDIQSSPSSTSVEPAPAVLPKGQ